MGYHDVIADFDGIHMGLTVVDIGQDDKVTRAPPVLTARSTAAIQREFRMGPAHPTAHRRQDTVQEPGGAESSSANACRVPRIRPERSAASAVGCERPLPIRPTPRWFHTS